MFPCPHPHPNKRSPPPKKKKRNELVLFAPLPLTSRLTFEQDQLVQFSHSVVSDSATKWTAAHQASVSITNSWSLLKFMSIESVMPCNHLILCHPLLLLPSIIPSIRVFSNESVLHSRWPKVGASASALVHPINVQG